MKFYRFVPDSDLYDSLLFVDNVWQISENFVDGKRLGDSWMPPGIEDYIVGQKGEFPSLDRIMPVVSKKAMKVLRSLMNKSVEILPLNSDYWVLNILDVLNCLELDKSKITRNPVTQRVSSIQKYVLHLDKIADKHIFKITETKGLEVIISDNFREIVEKNNLNGLSFSEVIFG